MTWRGATELAWSARAKAWVVLLPRGTRFTADELTAAIGMPDEPNKVGAYFSGWSRAGLIVRSGGVRSTRPESRGAYVGIWVRTP